MRSFSAAVERYVRPATLPIAVKMLEKGDEIPENMKKPMRNFNVKLLPCQATALSRKHGMPVAMTKEDFNTDLCPAGSIVFGVEPAVDWWGKGNIAFKIYTKTLEAAETMEKNVFRFEYGKYVGFMSAPLDEVNFQPDMVMIYCNSAQAMSLVAASRYEDGLPVRTTIAARIVCSDAVVQTIQTGSCHVCIPCGGDRANAYAGSDEIIFTAPMNKLQTIVEGLENAPKAIPPAIMRMLGARDSIMDKKYLELARILRREAGR